MKSLLDFDFFSVYDHLQRMFYLYICIIGLKIPR